MSKRQDFNRRVGQVFQSENVYISNDTTIPESKKQADFARDTKMWCPKPVRERFEWLMETQDMTSKALSRAWNSTTIKWVEEQQDVILVAPHFEAFASWFYAGVATLLYGTYAGALVWYGVQRDWKFGLIFGSVSAVYLSSMWLIAYVHMVPRRIADKVKRKLIDYKN